jgi:FAD/FMN-containing dehydrogenase
VNRRKFLLWGAGAVAAVAGIGVGVRNKWGDWFPPVESLLVNDMHSKLNPATASEILHPTSLEDLIGTVRAHARGKKPIAVSGARHAMGGQQFSDGHTLIDTRSMNGILDLDTERGIVELEAGIDWPTLVDELLKRQADVEQPWTIANKQTGADKLTIGGALSANAHGRSLTRPPFVSDVESFLLVDCKGELKRCSRTENSELFSLVIGGYGLFGIIHSVQLRLVRRTKIERVVETVSISDLVEKFDERIKDGYISGDFQFLTDEDSPDFLTTGVFSCYRPVANSSPIPDGQDSISDREWNELVYLAHAEKARAFKLYSDFYQKTSGQIYWSDTSQIGTYPLDYHLVIDKRLKSAHPGTEMITEIYVPRKHLAIFMGEAANHLRNKASVIYGTVRLIEKDTETFLAWAKQDYACIIFNLHIDHEPAKISEAQGAFRHLIDLASILGGSYYLTYHRWALKDQVLSCYPQFPEFLAKKRQYDPDGIFQSDWYRHYEKMFA